MEAKIRPRLAAGDGPLKVPRQPAIAPKPGEGPLDDPSPEQYLKTLSVVGSLDQRPLPRPASAVSSLLPAPRHHRQKPALAKAGDLAQPWEEVADRSQRRLDPGCRLGGLALLPPRSRACSTSRKLTFSNSPLACQA